MYTWFLPLGFIKASRSATAILFFKSGVSLVGVKVSISGMFSISEFGFFSASHSASSLASCSLVRKGEKPRFSLASSSSLLLGI
jgi:hypothetical protein